MRELFGEATHTHTRHDLIKDGELVDVSEIAKEAGFKVPVAITKTVYEGYIVPTTKDKLRGQDEEGRLWDTLWMLRVAIKSAGISSSLVHYQVIYVIDGKEEIKQLKALSHPGDQGEHVITIMLPNED